MKKVILGMLLASSVFAAEPKLLISKWSGGGFMAPEYAGSETCEVWNDHVVVKHNYGFGSPTALEVSEQRPLSVKGDVAAVIAKAASEQVAEKPNGLCDGPATTIVANSGEQEGLLLYTTGGCGSPRKERQGVFASKLREIVNLYCPKTYDFGAGR